MTLIDDSLEQVKASVLMAVKNELIETYPNEFGDYKTGRDDIYTKIYWADTVRYQPRYPYCTLTPDRDTSAGYEEITYLRIDGVYTKRTTTRSFLTVTIDVYDMGDEQSKKSSLKSDTFAYKVARQLRKYFNGDGKLDWFSGNEYYPNQIGINIDSDIKAMIDWSDTDTLFRYSFDILLGWNDVVDQPVDLAEGAIISVKENEKVIEDNITVKFK